MIREYCDKRKLKNLQEPRTDQKTVDENVQEVRYEDLTIDEKREHRRKFANAVMKYWAKSRGFMN